jgi:hypothetical protein
VEGEAMKFIDSEEGALRRRIQFYGYQCGWCGNRPGRDFHHIQPEAAGGSDEWDNLIWVCETCHTLLDEFCRKHWNDPDQQEKMREVRSFSIATTFQFCEGTINKKKSTEQWNFGNIFEMGKAGKTTEVPRTADDMWKDLYETKKYMKIDRYLCLRYLLELALYKGEPVLASRHDDERPVVIAAPTLDVLLEKAKELQGEQTRYKQSGTVDEAREYKRREDELEDTFFHTVFRPSS